MTNVFEVVVFPEYMEYMFLLGGNIMPGKEKLWGKLLFPDEKMVVFFDRREKKQFFQRETNVLLRVFLTQA